MNPYPALILALLLPACRRSGTPMLGKGSPASPGEARVSAGLPSKPPQFSDVLGAWAKRFAQPPAGASDAPLPKLPPKALRKFEDLFQTATSTARSLARYRSRAKKDIAAAGPEAVAALDALLTAPEIPHGTKTKSNSQPKPRPASSLSDDQSMGVLLLLPAGEGLATLCLRHLEDAGRPLLRQACARRLGEMGFPHALPKLLRRLKYETDPDALIAVFLALGKLGNPQGLANLLAWRRDPKWAPRAGAPLAALVQLLGQTYDPKTDGWPGLIRKAQNLLQTFHEKGSLSPKPSPPDERTLREYWLFLRHLNGTKLRPIDDARFICKRAGDQPVPLLRDACLDQHQGVRVRILQILIDLGHPSHPALDRVRPLLADPLCAPYAIEAIGALGGKDAWATLRPLLQDRPIPRTPKDRELRIATLKALIHLEEEESIPLLQQVFRQSAKDLEIQIYAAAALRTAARSQAQRAENFLKEVLRKKTFHPPTVRELLDR